MWTGFSRLEVFPSPKSQAHPVGDPAEVSVNETVRGTFPAVGLAVNWAMGGGMERGVGLGVSSGVMVSVGTGDTGVVSGAGVAVGEEGGRTGGCVMQPATMTARRMHTPAGTRGFIARTHRYSSYSFPRDLVDLDPHVKHGPPHLLQNAETFFSSRGYDPA
jgi:hypothetical protein